MTRYRMGLDADGVFHLQAAFGPNPDFNFKWRSGFVLFLGSDGVRWGIWNGHTVLLSVEGPRALPLIEALLAKGYYVADTLLPDVTETPEGLYAVVIPPEHVERVDLDAPSMETLRTHKAFLEA